MGKFDMTDGTWKVANNVHVSLDNEQVTIQQTMFDEVVNIDIDKIPALVASLTKAHEIAISKAEEAKANSGINFEWNETPVGWVMDTPTGDRYEVWFTEEFNWCGLVFFNYRNWSISNHPDAEDAKKACELHYLGTIG